MRLIKPKFEIIEQGSGVEGMFKQIEKAGRTCYKSEDKITPTSAKSFVDRMIKSGHGAMLEHGTVYLECPENIYQKYIFNKYSKYEYDKKEIKSRKEYEGSLYYFTDLCTYYVTTNLRVLVENNWLDDLKYICNPTKHHEKRVTVRFVCDRGVSHEFVRHRVFSFAQESTRYCNYSKDKFDGALTYIIPSHVSDIPDNTVMRDRLDVTDFVWKPTWLGKEVTISKFTQTFLYHCISAETDYIGLISRGIKPQEARAVLPNALKTELVMTGFISDWKHFFELRCAPSAHPDARALAVPLRDEFLTREYL